MSARQCKLMFGLWSLQGFFAFLWIVMIPTDAENPALLGFSPARLMLLSAALIPAALFALLSFRYDVLERQRFWLKVIQREAFWDVLYIASVVVVFSSIFVLVIFNLLHRPSLYDAYALRLQPLQLWLGLSGLECAFFIGRNRYEQVKDILNPLRPVFIGFAAALGFLVILGLLLIVTGIGITPIENLGGPPVPYFEWQILLVLLIIGIAACLSRTRFGIKKNWAPLLIYVLTVFIWCSQPINPGFTATPPRAPNFEIYPFSDPLFYAQYAQSALTGNGFYWPEIPSRPFYDALLTWFHLLGNQSYPRVIFIQSLLLAFFPVILYLLGKEIGGWPLGVGLSLLTIFRDVNSNNAVLLANNVTNSKLFLSELPTALFISLAMLLLFFWWRSIHRTVWLSALIGGVIGVAVLIRLQSVVFIFVAIAMTFFMFSDRKQWLINTLLLVTGLGVVVAPWFARNYLAAGGFVLDNPLSQTMTMARRWSGSWGNEILPRLPGENDAQYSNRLTQMSIKSFLQHPGFILRTTAYHFVDNTITSLLAFPVRDELRSPTELFLPQHAFWDLPFTSERVSRLVINIIFFALGLSAAWRRLGLVGFFPLCLGIAYNLWTSLFFSSGARFIVPIDWSFHLYQFFGILLLCGFLLSFTKIGKESLYYWFPIPKRVDAFSPSPPSYSRRNLIGIFLVLLVLGGFTPCTESVFPQKYPPKPQEEILEQIGATAESGEIALYGRAIYPRYYAAGDGEPETAKLGYEVSETPRLVFYLTGSAHYLVIFNLDSPPEYFPNVSDVYMVGEQINGYFSPRVVFVTKGGRAETYEIAGP